MNEDLLSYYETELRFIREGFREFGNDHPALAQRLMINGDQCDDPHVERMIQGFALIAGRIRLKLDEQFPEITESLLGITAPNYLAPVPSCAIGQFELDSRHGKMTGRRVIPRATSLYTRSIVNFPVSCQFRTVYPTTLWPLQLVSAKLLPATALPGGVLDTFSSGVIRLTFECHGEATPQSMKLDSLRFHIHGEGEIPYTLYELLDNNLLGVWVSGSDEEETTEHYRLPNDCLSPVGFSADESLLPASGPAFAGYRFLTEYFSFPDKFLFFDLNGLDTIPLEALGKKFEVNLVLGEFERKERLRNLGTLLRKENFQLGCTPIINLFGRTAEPIAVTHTEKEYRVSPDPRNPLAAEVYSVDKVTSVPPYGGQLREYQPLYAFRHHYDSTVPNAFWLASRRAANRKADRGTEVYLSLVDNDFRPTDPGTDVLTVRITCSNRDLPAKMPLNHQFGELLLEESAGIRARFLTSPTESVRPPLRSSLQWRLISHLALNYLSLSDSSGAALREILQLYNYMDDPGRRNQIAGILSVSSRQHMTRVLTEAGVAFPLGLRVEIEFDEANYAGNGVYLLASVLERFLGLYSSVNSFTQLTARTRQRKEFLRRWPPRAGEQILL